MKTKILFLSIIVSILACSKTDSVTPTPTKSSAKTITSFVISSLTPNVTATIDEATKTISALVPIGTDITKITPTIAVSDKATVSPASGTAQDFSKSVEYAVTAEDGSKQFYTVTIQAISNILFYNAANGAGTVIDNKNFAAVNSYSMAKDWTDVVNIGSNQVLFYNSATGNAMITDNTKFTKIKEFTIEKGLGYFTYMGFNTLKVVGGNFLQILKNSTTLETFNTFPNLGDDLTIFIRAGANKEQSLYYSTKTGVYVQVDTQTNATFPVTNSTAFDKGFTNLVNLGNGFLLLYNSTSGASEIHNDIAPFGKIRNITLPTGYTNIVNIGSNQLLFYNAKTGESMLTDNKNFTKITATFPTSAGNWSHILGL
jgi:Domain of unknown function (DUF5018)